MNDYGKTSTWSAEEPVRCSNAEKFSTASQYIPVGTKANKTDFIANQGNLQN
jgi:hypothetical protein